MKVDFKVSSFSKIITYVSFMFFILTLLIGEGWLISGPILLIFFIFSFGLKKTITFNSTTVVIDVKIFDFVLRSKTHCINIDEEFLLVKESNDSDELGGYSHYLEFSTNSIQLYGDEDTIIRSFFNVKKTTSINLKNKTRIK